MPPYDKLPPLSPVSFSSPRGKLKLDVEQLQQPYLPLGCVETEIKSDASMLQPPLRALWKS